MRTFKSILNSNQAYHFLKEWNWDKRGHAPLSLYLEKFETYGDGTVQHSGSWCAQWADLRAEIEFIRRIARIGQFTGRISP